MARSSVYSFRQGPRDAGGSGPDHRARTAAMGGTVAADGKTATIPYGGKPDGASATSYAEFKLILPTATGGDGPACNTDDGEGMVMLWRSALPAATSICQAMARAPLRLQG